MRSMKMAALAAAIGAAILAPRAKAQIGLTSDATYTQDFNTLATTGTSSILPTGWMLVETGTSANATYRVGDGSGNSGDTYSFGTGSSTDRALGTLQSGSVVPTIGAVFANNTGSTITGVTIGLTGEQWRLGATGRTDRLDFQYSTDATSLTTGTWTSVTALNVVSVVTTGTPGALDGNGAANRTVISPVTISGLSIAPGNTFYIRWSDYNASGADDGLAIDDFSLSTTLAPVGTSTPPSGIGTASPSTVNGGDSCLLTVAVTPGTNPASTGLSVTANLTGIGGSASQTLYDDGTNGDVTAGDGTYSCSVSVAAATTGGAKNLPVTISDAQSRSGSANVALTVNPPLYTVAQARGLAPSTSTPVYGTVKVHGIVAAISTGNAYIVDPDGSAGIMVYDGTNSDGVSPLQMGDDATVTGNLYTFQGEIELDTATHSAADITVASHGNTLPTATAITLAEATDANEGRLVSLPSLRVKTAPATMTGTTSSFTAEDAAGNTISVYLFRNATTGAATPYPGVPANPIGMGTTSVTFPEIRVGRLFAIRGMLSEGGATPVRQIKPRDANDIIAVTPSSLAATGPVHSSPVAYNGIVYFGSDDAKFYAYNVSNGTPATAVYPFSAGSPVLGRPALRVIDGNTRLFFTTADARVFCLNADGTPVWSTDPLIAGATAVRSTPAVIADTDPGDPTQRNYVYVAAGNGTEARLFKLRADDGSVVRSSLPFGSDVKSSPAAGAGSVFVGVQGSGTQPSGILRISPYNLDILTNLAANTVVDGSPFIYGPTSSFAAYPVAYAGATDGRLFGVNAFTGSPLAGFKDAADGSPDGVVTVASGVSLSSIYVYGNKVYAGGSDNMIYAVNAQTGSHAVFFDAGTASGSTGKAVTGGVGIDPLGRTGTGTLAFGSTDGSFYQVSLADPTAFVYTPGAGAINTTPTVDQANASVLIGSDDGKVYRFPRY